MSSARATVLLLLLFASCSPPSSPPLAPQPVSRYQAAIYSSQLYQDMLLAMDTQTGKVWFWTLREGTTAWGEFAPAIEPAAGR